MRALALLALLLASAPAAAAPPAPGTYAVHAIDVGTGLSVFVEGNDFALLYDAGSNDDSGRGAKNRVLAYLRAVRPDLTRIDHLILSHPHKDHHEMMDDIFDAYDVDHVWDSGSLNDTCGYRAFLDAVIAEPGVVYHDALGSGGNHVVTFAKGGKVSCHGRKRPPGVVSVPRGSQMSLTPVRLGAGASMTVLQADGTKPDDHLNDASVVVRLDLGRRKILLTGDEEAEFGDRNPPTKPPRAGSAEAKLIALGAPRLASDILVVSHHGSMTSSRNLFLDAVGAKQFIVSVGPTEYSGTVLPDKEVTDELDRRGDVWLTNHDDEACEKSKAKIGPDADGKPGGCDHVRAVIDAAGGIQIGHFRPTD